MRNATWNSLFLISMILMLSLSVRAEDANENPSKNLPPELQGIGINEKPGNLLPLDAPFIDERGRPRALGDYFKTGKPVILQIGYFGCPHLCDMVSRGMIDTRSSS